MVGLRHFLLLHNARHSKQCPGHPSSDEKNEKQRSNRVLLRCFSTILLKNASDFCNNPNNPSDNHQYQKDIINDFLR